MPRKPQFDSPVRSLRQALGNSQEKFARFLGISRNHLQKIELGERNLSADLADLLTAAFGVSRAEIQRKRGRARHLFERGGHYDLSENINMWQKLTDQVSKMVAESGESYFLPKLQVLFEAAEWKQKLATRKYPRSIAIGVRLDRWIDEVSRAFALTDRIKQIRAE